MLAWAGSAKYSSMQMQLTSPAECRERRSKYWFSGHCMTAAALELGSAGSNVNTGSPLMHSCTVDGTLVKKPTQT
jgi:hypothetical protein